jgi:WD40-like Beta Propeller Repeat
MATLLPPPTQAPSASGQERQGADLDLLVREARARQRRRRLRLLVALLGALAIGGVVYGSFGTGGSGTAGVEAIPNGPVVNLRAFAHQGSLAFISRGTLWLLDGQRALLRRVASHGGRFRPVSPSFSPDGKWLAYLETPRSGNESYSQLWIARSDGSDAHVIQGLQVASLYGWSPTQDLVAVAAGPERTKRPCPCYSPTTLRVASPQGSVRTLARSSWIYGAAWSPNAQSIAVSEITYPVSKLVVYPTAGGPGTTWFRMGAHQRLNRMNGILFQLAGWWRNLGIGFWVFGDGMIHNLDATPLDLVSSAGVRPRLLGRTLSDGGTDAIAATANGNLAIVTDHGGGRAAWQDKQVELCGPISCGVVSHAPGTVTVDPAWSSNGKTLAYAQAPNVLAGPWSQKRIAAWFAAHRILLYNTANGHTRSVPEARGATAVSWSPNHRSLLYVRDDALWLLPTLTSQPVRIATPLFPPHNWPQYYAEIAWSAQFAWSPR